MAPGAHPHMAYDADDPVELAHLKTLMSRAVGAPEVAIGLVDGPVDATHPLFSQSRLVPLSGSSAPAATCRTGHSAACRHGTFVAGILASSRGGPAPALCPGCTLLVRPIFFGHARSGTSLTATADDVAAAINDCVRAGAQVVNLSAALAGSSVRTERRLEEALHAAARQGVLVVAAAGNRATLAGSVITRHPAVIPVVACDGRGLLVDGANIGNSIGRHGLTAPGNAIRSLGPDGGMRVGGGSSAATAFVTGAAALLLSAFPGATPGVVRSALLGATPRRSITPPLLNGDLALSAMDTHSRRVSA
jgi:subtilisin family serine protease